MEVGSGGGGGHGGGATDELEKDKAEGEPRVKRKMKTPSQLEILEKTYAVESYPSEALRAELSVKLGLSDRQLQMWFCHRRLKDRKPAAEKRSRKTASPSAVLVNSGGCADEPRAINADVTKKEFSSGLSLFGNMDSFQRQQRVVHKVGTAVPRISTELPVMRRFYEPPLAVSEQRAIAFVEAQLGEPLREDGPILGMEFDPLPPGAFGAPIVPSGQQKPAGRPCDIQLNERLDTMPIKGSSRALHEYQFLPEKPYARNDAHERALPPHYYGSPSDIRNARVPLATGKSSMHNIEQVHSGYGLHGQMPSFSLLPQQGRQGLQLSPASGDVDVVPRIAPLMDVNIDTHYVVHPKNGMDNQIVTPDRVIIHDEMKMMERKRKTEEARIAKEVQAHDKRIRKEQEKENMLRRKKEEQMRKEMERKDRERRKEEERMLREKQREEERYQREQRREMERREKFLQKEYIRAEKMRLREEIRREKEAVRIKTASNRAAARRIAKESIDLIEDERLELMELAAASKGLSSILALDGDALQNIDSLKDKLPGFPPKSVHLKKPFGVQPWTDSEENVGNLIMVWRFLITFADVLGLWPFTLDEFTQAFYDFDPRLLGEIHVALLRSIIKDIEDVARTSATALATNQSSAVNPGGGHKHIVEGAYAWGFDLHSWQRYLSPLTWPEVLRQFALSAGFGPKLKKRKVEPGYAHDTNEVDDGAEIISNLRSGLAVENAVALMQERGLSNRRRSRHCLTPGTVKFAAFHILSLVGSKGLSILEVAEKIQKSGLRDLTTSKTPEASISAALSRDTKLFERTAPSTYCVRSPYRKDPVDTESILAAAREKIRMYQNGIAEGEDAEDVEKEDAEQDQDSDSEVAEDPDADDLDTELKVKETSYSSEMSNLKNKSFSHHGKESLGVLSDTSSVSQANLKGSSLLTHSFREIKTNGGSLLDVTGAHSYSISDKCTAVIDECDSVEPWVQGLTEGEYTDLSIEERLNALVALTGIANEGNAIRLALEERLEAANALKKQMWAEAQLDKRRVKDEQVSKLQHSSFAGSRADQIFSQFAVEDRRSPLGNSDMRNEVSSSNRTFLLVDLNDQQCEQSSCNDAPTQDPLISDTLLLQQTVYATEKSRKELKAFIGHHAEELYVYRSLPLGLDRRFNRYWQLITSPSPNDPYSGRIFVELFNGVWRLIDSEEDFDALLSSLDVRGTRECHLHSMLLKVEASFKATAMTNLSRASSVKHVSDGVNQKVLHMRPKLDCYSSTNSSESFVFASYSNSPENELPFPNEFGKKREVENGIIESHCDFEKWMMNECLNSKLLAAQKYGRLRCQPLLDTCKYCHELFSCDDAHCPSCRRTLSTSEKTFDFLEHVIDCERKPSEGFGRVLHKLSFSLQIRLLKAQLATIEASTPPDAFKSVWSDENRKSWGRKLHLSSSAAELLETLTLLENSIERNFLSASYEATCEFLGSSNHIDYSADSFSRPGAVVVLAWIPQTTSAVALRLMELDSSIYYTPQRKEACLEDNESEHFIKFPSRMGNSIDNVSRAGYLQHDNWLDHVSGQISLKRGRGRPRGPSRTIGKSRRKTSDCRDDQCHVTIERGERFEEITGWRGRPSGCKKGRRSVRNRQKLAKRVTQNAVENRVSLDKVSKTPYIRKEEWDLEETPIEAVGGANLSSSEQSDFDDLNVQASADEYNDILADLPDMGSVDYEVDVEDDQHVDVGNRDNMDDDDEDDDVENFEPLDYVGDFNGQYHDEENQSAGAEQVGNVDRSRGSSSSSDYSF